MHGISRIPYGHQWINGADIKEVVKVLRSDWITQGPDIKRFEYGLCSYTKARYAVAVSSGTAALHLACLAAGIKEGDEVIASPMTFVASANCILYCKAMPVFADIEHDTGNIRTEEISRLISKKTKAVIPVHFAGHSCSMNKLRALAKKSGIIIIEDAAHALGTEYRGSKIGSCKYSDMTILSFHPVKAITTGEGGAVLTNRRDMYEKLMMLRSHGITRGRGLIDKKMAGCDWYYEMQYLGFNYRMTDIQAALGLSQLKKLNKFIKNRRHIAAAYDKAFAGNDFFYTPIEKEYSRSAYHLYPIRLKEEFISRRKEVFSRMRGEGLGVQVHYAPVYSQPYYKSLGFKKGSCPQAESYYNSEISLPIYPSLTRAQIRYVIDTVLKVFNGL